jgi:hypothetical protein
VRIEFRWGARGRERIQQNTAEMVALAPDVVVANSASIAGSMKEATRNIPIVLAETLLGSLSSSLASPRSTRRAKGNAGPRCVTSGTGAAVQRAPR